MLSDAGNVLMVVAGTAVIAATMLDLVRTTMSLRRAEPEPATESPPAPRLPRLAEAGIAVVSEAEFATALGRGEARRRCLHRILRHQGWEWQPVSDRGWPRGPG